VAYKCCCGSSVVHSNFFGSSAVPKYDFFARGLHGAFGGHTTGGGPHVEETCTRWGRWQNGRWQNGRTRQSQTTLTALISSKDICNNVVILVYTTTI
jgi:hypothetical protein